MELNVVNQLNLIGSIKFFTKLNWFLYMKERLKVFKKLCAKNVTLMNNYLEIYRVLGINFFHTIYIVQCWIPVTLTSCFTSNTQMEYLMFNIDYSDFTIWHPLTIWHIFTFWHILTILINTLICLLAKMWALLTIIIQSISSIYCILKSVTTYSR